MQPYQVKHTLSTRILILLHIFLGLGGLGGGIAMLLDPSGRDMGLPADLLDGIWIDTFFFPGLFLILIMGTIPLLLAYGLWKWPRWDLMEKINPIQKFPWPWSFSFLLGLVLIGWILFQIILWGNPVGIQILYLGIGSLMSIIAYLDQRNQKQSIQENKE